MGAGKRFGIRFVLVWLALVVAMLIVPLAGRRARADEPVRLYLFAGQSNMVGEATSARAVRSIDPHLLRRVRNVLFWGPTDDAAKRWGALTLPTEVAQSSSHDGFGPEFSAAAMLAARHPHATIAIVKLARDGTTLSSDWNPANRAGLYEAAVRRVRAAEAALAATRHRGVHLDGIFWMQGEQDASRYSRASTYDAHLVAFISALRRDLHAPTVPFVIGRIADLRTFDPTMAYSSVVRAAQERVGVTVPDTYLVSTDALPRSKASPIHFTSRGIIELGREFVNAAAQL
jgi:hypothetical protein